MSRNVLIRNTRKLFMNENMITNNGERMTEEKEVKKVEPIYEKLAPDEVGCTPVRLVKK